jgi:hypothetical protein
VRFTHIPDRELEFHGGLRMVFVGPEGSGVEPLETMRRELTIGDVSADAFTARVELEPGDLALLAEGAPIYVTQYGGLIPVAVDIPVERVYVPDTAAELTEEGTDG